MTVTSFIGLTFDERRKAVEEQEHECFQLEEIVRHYKSRMRRRQARMARIMAKAFSTGADYKAHHRWKQKLEEMKAHEDRDDKCWSGAIDRLNALNSQLCKMYNELNAYRSTIAAGTQALA